MPTYEYACTSCEEHVEVVQSFRDDPLSACPACGGQLRKVFGSIGVVFKGSGFYKTDSRASDSKKSTKPEKAAERSESASGSEKSSAGSEKSSAGSEKSSSGASGSSSSSGDKSSSSSATAAAS